MTDTDVTAASGDALGYVGKRVDRSSYAQPVTRFDALRSSELFCLWPCELDGVDAILKEAAGGPRSVEAKRRLRREQRIMRRLADEVRAPLGAGETPRDLSPFLGSGEKVRDLHTEEESGDHPHHFTRRHVTLRNHVDPTVGDRPSRRDLMDLVIDSFRALTELHRADVLHRDIKPSNLIVDRATSQVGFIDFGHALDRRADRGEDEPATGEGGFVGSEGWMCPHCYTERTQDELCDVFAMALVGSVILTEQSKVPLPILWRRDGDGGVQRVGGTVGTDLEVASQHLETYRKGLEASRPSGDRGRMLDVLLTALVPEPRGADDAPLRVTAEKMYVELVRARHGNQPMALEPPALVATPAGADPALKEVAPPRGSAANGKVDGSVNDRPQEPVREPAPVPMGADQADGSPVAEPAADGARPSGPAVGPPPEPDDGDDHAAGKARIDRGAPASGSSRPVGGRRPARGAVAIQLRPASALPKPDKVHREAARIELRRRAPRTDFHPVDLLGGTSVPPVEGMPARRLGPVVIGIGSIGLLALVAILLVFIR